MKFTCANEFENSIFNLFIDHAIDLTVPEIRVSVELLILFDINLQVNHDAKTCRLAVVVEIRGRRVRPAINVAVLF